MAGQCTHPEGKGQVSPPKVLPMAAGILIGCIGSNFGITVPAGTWHHRIGLPVIWGSCPPEFHELGKDWRLDTIECITVSSPSSSSTLLCEHLRGQDQPRGDTAFQLSWPHFSSSFTRPPPQSCHSLHPLPYSSIPLTY